MSEVRELLLIHYLDQRPKEHRYGAALLALEWTMLAWDRWVLALGPSCPESFRRAPHDAHEAVQRWLAGDVDGEGLVTVAQGVRRAWQFADERVEHDQDARLPSVSCGAATFLVLVATEEATGRDIWPSKLHLADAVLAASVVIEELNADDGAFISAWMAQVEARWPAIH